MLQPLRADAWGRWLGFEPRLTVQYRVELPLTGRQRSSIQQNDSNEPDQAQQPVFIQGATGGKDDSPRPGSETMTAEWQKRVANAAKQVGTRWLVFQNRSLAKRQS
jgi:hypothetical protein